MYIKDKQFTEFVSVNGLPMVEGEWINWQKCPIYRDRSEPFVLQVSFGTMSEMWVLNYYYEEDKLTSGTLSYDSNGPFLSFYVNSLEMAEVIALAIIKGMGEEIAPLYDKSLNSWNH